MAAVSPFGLATRTAGIRKESLCRPQNRPASPVLSTSRVLSTSSASLTSPALSSCASRRRICGAPSGPVIRRPWPRSPSIIAISSNPPPLLTAFRCAPPSWSWHAGPVSPAGPGSSGTSRSSWPTAGSPAGWRQPGPWIRSMAFFAWRACPTPMTSPSAGARRASCSSSIRSSPPAACTPRPRPPTWTRSGAFSVPTPPRPAGRAAPIRSSRCCTWPTRGRTRRSRQAPRPRPRGCS
jgi:hypothetical protein